VNSQKAEESIVGKNVFMANPLLFDDLVKSYPHTKITENTKKNLNVFNKQFLVSLCLGGKN
jgi:hypothetical protein